ncbi:MAG: ATP-binding protein [Deltaproteobacteria bacterium]
MATLTPALHTLPAGARIARPGASTEEERKTPQQVVAAVRDLARGTLPGTAFHVAGLLFVEVGMPNADHLPRAAVILVFLFFVVLRLVGFWLTTADRGTLAQRVNILAIGAIGANLVWGVRTVAVQLHTGASEQSNVISVIILGLATGALTAFAQTLWVQRGALSALFVPVIVAGCTGHVPAALAVLHALFYAYTLTQGTAAHRRYWDSVHATESLRCNAVAAQLAAITAEDTTLRLRDEIARSVKIEVELRQAQKLEAIGRLAAGIAHEINTPVQFISDSCRFLGEGVQQLNDGVDDYRRIVRELADGQIGPADALAGSVRIDDERDLAFLRDHLSASTVLALDGLKRIADIVAATKEFAYPHQKEKVPTDVNSAIQSTLIIANSQTRYVADITCELGPLPTVPCHRGELNQVILNLVVNAAHAIGDVVKNTGSRGVIKIKTWAEPHRVRISISDTGTGMTPEVLEKIYEPFFTTKPVGTGTGQGLAISRSAIVDKHGGTIEVQSELGVGTTFTISLPR